MPHGTCRWDKEGSGQPPGGDISWGLESHGDVFVFSLYLCIVTLLFSFSID